MIYLVTVGEGLDLDRPIGELRLHLCADTRNFLVDVVIVMYVGFVSNLNFLVRV